MSVLERLIRLVTATHRWDLHPLKVAIALLLPVSILWLAEWRIRRLTSAAEARDHAWDDASPTRSRAGG